jgi:hypothetical protein
MAAQVIPLHLHQLPQVAERLKELKAALATENLYFFQVALDESAKLGPSHRAVAIMERAFHLLLEARIQFELEHI